MAAIITIMAAAIAINDGDAYSNERQQRASPS